MGEHVLLDEGFAVCRTFHQVEVQLHTAAIEGEGELPGALVLPTDSSDHEVLPWWELAAYMADLLAVVVAGDHFTVGDFAIVYLHTTDQEAENFVLVMIIMKFFVGLMDAKVHDSGLEHCNKDVGFVVGKFVSGEGFVEVMITLFYF